MFRALIVAPLITGLLMLTPAPAQAAADGPANFGITGLAGCRSGPLGRIGITWTITGAPGSVISAASNPELVGDVLPATLTVVTTNTSGPATLSVTVGTYTAEGLVGKPNCDQPPVAAASPVVVPKVGKAHKRHHAHGHHHKRHHD